jgi:hypothetical protein
MNRTRWYIIIGLSLLALSALTYLFQIFLFQRTEDTFYYMMQDLAFVPIQVLLVTIIVSEILARREKQAMLNKMNMVIGAFFSEVGTELLRTLSDYDRNNDSFVTVLLGNKDWSDRKFDDVKKYLETHEFGIDTRDKDMESLKGFLVRRRAFLLRLLENPNLLEHDSFTDLLWAVTHLTEELAYRYDVMQLAEPDRKHLEGDIARAYPMLILEWLAYIRHLRDNYPYIFHLIARINPFDKAAAAEVP